MTLNGRFYLEVPRPPRNRRRRPDELYWDGLLEQSLMTTVTTGKALEIRLAEFHRSPAKGRLWKKGFRLLHRVVNDIYVHAWVEPK